MSTAIKFLGHGTFLVETEVNGGTVSILIDPFLTENPQASLSAEAVPADVILVSHGHFDHVGDTIAIAQRTGSLVVTNFEISQWLGRQGVDNTHPMHLGGSHRFEWGAVKLTVAHHGSGLPDGSCGGSPCGFLLKLAEGTIYHACDTALFSDMRLIGDEGVDVAILPIGDNFTMGPDDAIKATQWVRPQRVIPDHFNTWPPIEQDVAAWAEQVRGQTEAEPIILQPGESCSL